jgi:hypothetical protein
VATDLGKPLAVADAGQRLGELDFIGRRLGFGGSVEVGMQRLGTRGGHPPLAAMGGLTRACDAHAPSPRLASRGNRRRGKVGEVLTCWVCVIEIKERGRDDRSTGPDV